MDSLNITVSYLIITIRRIGWKRQYIIHIIYNTCNYYLDSLNFDCSTVWKNRLVVLNKQTRGNVFETPHESYIKRPSASISPLPILRTSNAISYIGSRHSHLSTRVPFPFYYTLHPSHKAATASCRSVGHPAQHTYTQYTRICDPNETPNVCIRLCEEPLPIT